VRPGLYQKWAPALLGRMRCSTARRLPVLLVHGRGGTARVWTPLRAALGDAGFNQVVGLDDTQVCLDLDTVATEVARRAFVAMAASGSDRVHLVGHGLGGVVVRSLAARGALTGLTATAMTVACPHGDTRAAGIAFARRTGTRPTRWVSYFTDQDLVVSPATARLSGRGPDVTNLLIQGCGHLTICRDARLIRSVVHELTRSENPAGAGALSGPEAYAQAA